MTALLLVAVLLLLAVAMGARGEEVRCVQTQYGSFREAERDELKWSAGDVELDARRLRPAAYVAVKDDPPRGLLCVMFIAVEKALRLAVLEDSGKPLR